MIPPNMMVRIPGPTGELKKAFHQELARAEVEFLQGAVGDDAPELKCRELLEDLIANPPADADPKDGRIFYTLDGDGITAYYKTKGTPA